MIIEIDESITNLPKLIGTEEDSFAIFALELIGHSIVCGYHAIIGNRNVFDFLASLAPLSIPSRNAYKLLFNDYSRVETLKNLTKPPNNFSVLRLVYGQNEPVILISESITCVNISFAGNHTFLGNKSCIMGEDRTDGVFFEILAKKYLRAKCNLPESFITLGIRGGGGSQTGISHVELCKEQSNFCLCIVDSDKESPNWQFGSTASKCLEENKRLNLNGGKYLGRLVILECREIENLLPLKLIALIHPNLQLMELINSNHHELIDCYAYIDLKKGVNVKTIMDVKKTDPNFIGPLEALLEISRICPSASECSRKRDKLCARCEVIAGQENILSFAIEKILQDRNTDWFCLASQDCSTLIGKEILRVGKYAAEWGICYPPRRG